MRSTSGILCVLLVLPFTLAAGAADEKGRGAKLLEQYQALASANEAESARAILALAARPDEAIALLDKRLQPVKVDAPRVAKWIEQLGDDGFAVRQDASQKLAYLGKFVRPQLEKALESTKDAEVKKRLTTLLGQIPDVGQQAAKKPVLAGRNVSVVNRNGVISIMIDGKPVDLNPPPAAVAKPNRQIVQTLRGIAILEQVGTGPATKILKRLSEGEAGSEVTREARAALARLGRAKGSGD